MSEVAVSSPVRFALANGALLEVPVFETNRRGKNWMAVICVDGTMPGGLGRRFLDRGRGECYYLVEQLALFDPIEFGADYVTGTGRKYSKRWYGVVTSKTDESLVIEPCEKGVAAILLSRAKRADPEAMASALEMEKQSLRTRMDEIQGVIEALRTPGAPAEEAVKGVLEKAAAGS